jgi:predicted helicase
LVDQIARSNLSEMGDSAALMYRIDADVRRRGKQFGHICKWLLTNNPTYKVTLRGVWLWNEWDDKWGGDAGIDLVFEDHDGLLWAFQCKAYDPARAVTEADADKSLSESSRAVFSYCLRIATTTNCTTSHKGRSTPRRSASLSWG